jgi:NAD+ synthase (glutamine-hydrolysing)
MGMEKNSSPQTRKRAADLAEVIGANHLDFDIDPVYDAQVKLLTSTTGFEPKFKMYGGTKVSNLALQNIQARLRMVCRCLAADKPLSNADIIGQRVYFGSASPSD